jgi:hypothetical protein
MIQRSFSSGEVDPALYGRADVDRWKAALKLCKNWVVQPEGGIVVRQGFELKARVAYTDQSTVRLVPFEFGPDDSYVQIFADGYMSLLEDGALVTGDVMRRGVTVNLSATPWVVTMTAHGYATGDSVTFYSSKFSLSTFAITKTGADTFTLDGTVSTGAGTLTGILARRTIIAAGSAPTVRYLVSATFDFVDGRYVQSGDTQYFADGVHSPLTLVREFYGSVDRALCFTTDDIDGYPPFATVASLAVTGGAGTDQMRYRVSYTDRDGVESSVIRSAETSSSAISGTTTLTVTSNTHGLITNDTIYVSDILLDNNGGEVYRPGDLVRVVVVDANNFKIPGNGVTASSDTLKYYRIGASVVGLSPTTASAMTVVWTLVPGAVTYNVYKEFGRVYGYIGSTSDVSFVDKGIIPDTKDNPIIGVSPFRDTTISTGNAPIAVGLFQQRLMFGGFTEDIERVVGSYIGDYRSYDPAASDDSGLDFILAGRTVSGIQHMLEIAGRAVVLTNTSEWVLKGSSGGALTPTSINARADSYYGCSDVAPALVGSSLIYVQRGDRIVREAKYDFAQEALASNDLTLWAKHLFTPEVKRIAYQRTAQILWVLRKDGVLLGMTYVPEQNVWGWHQHEIDGRAISDICVVSEDGTDRLYCAILDDSYVNVCRLPLNWETGDVDDHIGFDMALTYNGGLNCVGTLTGGSTWKTTESLTLTASQSVFVAGDVGKDFLLTLGDDDVYVLCTGYTSGTVITVKSRTLVPIALRSVASDMLYRCADTFTGLDHLEGETVGVIADGSREADLTVTSGSITTSRKFARLQAGIILTADAQTLDLEPDDKDTYLGDFKHVTRVYLRVRDTRGITTGLDADHLNPFVPEYQDLVNGEPTLRSGAIEILMDATHEDSGSVLIRQDRGLPANVLNARPVFNAGELK